MIFIAASTSFAFRSGIFSSAISRTFAREIVPTLLRFGSPEPYSMLACFLIRIDAGGVLVTNEKERYS